MTDLRIRSAVRALILTPDDHVLLVRFVFPTLEVWALPGGGLEPGEDHLAALRRELREEVGLDVDAGAAEIGPHVWTREHIIPFLDGRWDGQRDHVHLVRTERFEPTPHLSWDELRTERLHEIRWWSLDEVRRHDGTFAPRRLAALLDDLVATGPPTAPIDVGV